MARWWHKEWITVGATVGLIALGLAILFVALHESHQRRVQERRTQAQVTEKNIEIRQDFCVELEKVRGYIRAATERGQKSLPTIVYYRDHPEELVAAQENLALTLAAFNPPLNCPAFARHGSH